ncbi:MAG: neutral/alkaline non-lysosomal ceramidase N-terminal domain-containing protein [Kiritimatiellae bacterium]|nr:neutral/alkaline non-lysosomal ceramidase N-terminal domain-containing protein [Kiritimatiellia bacterium]
MTRKTGGQKNGKAGLAEVVVNPKLGTDLAGYSAWQRPATGIHDDLHIRSLVLENNGVAAAILSIPVCILDADITRAIREAGSRTTGIEPTRIMIHATHTHSAPYVRGAYAELLKKNCVACLKKAWAARFPAKLGYGFAQVSEGGKNRRYLDYGGLPVDTQVGVLKIEDLDGQLRGVVFNYACHGTCLDARNKLVTEDWPFYAIQAVKRQTNRNVMAMYLGGSAGDINPGYSAGLSAVAARLPTRTWAEAERIGRNVGIAAAGCLAQISTHRLRILRTRTTFIDLPLRKTYPVTVSEAKRRLANAKRELAQVKKGRRPSLTCIERAKVAVFFAELIHNGAIQFYSGKWKRSAKVELQALVVNEMVFATFPGEVFVTAGLDVKKRSSCPRTLIVGLANTHETSDYLPTREAYAEGDYEVYETKYDEMAAAVLVKATLRNIRAVWRRSKT